MKRDTKRKKVKSDRKAAANKQLQAGNRSNNDKKVLNSDKSISCYFVKAFKILLIISGLTGLYPLIHPDVSIMPSPTSKDRDPFRTKWIVTNSGWAPVNELKIDLRPHQINGTGFKASGPEDFSAKINFNAGNIGKLSAGKSTTFEAPIILGPSSTVVNADIAFSLQYRAKLFPFITWTKFQRFMPASQKDGTWEWYPYNDP